MKTIPLSQGKVVMVDDADYDWLNKWKWSAVKGRHTYYACRTISISADNRKRQYMHRAILDAPNELEVDHRDGNGLNNQRSNLRLCNSTQNRRNQKLSRRNITGFKGVTRRIDRNSRPFRAHICVKGRFVSLGSYSTAQEAAQEYDLAAIKYHGAFAMTNRKLGLI